MADAITDFILKPSAPFAAGVVLFGVVWGFFKGVESVLTDDTKLEIAVWLVGVRIAHVLEPWPDTFGVLFDSVFGKRHFSLNTFVRSAVTSLCVLAIVLTVLTVLHGDDLFQEAKYASRHIEPRNELVAFWARIGLYCNIFPAYVALLKTRFILNLCKGRPEAAHLIVAITVDFISAAAIAMFFLQLMAFRELQLITDTLQPLFLSTAWWLLWLCPALFTSIWLWLYAGSGFLLKFARRFDLGFDWFNHKLDIEHHPLSAIGLVAGALVA